MAGRSGPQTPSGGSGLRQSFSITTAPSASSDGLAPPRPGSPQPSPRSRPTTELGSGSGNYEVAENLNLAEAGPSDGPTETTALLQSVLSDRRCSRSDPCSHGTFSPRLTSPAPSDRSSDTGVDSGDGRGEPMPIIDGLISTITGSHNGSTWRRSLARKVRSKKMSTSSALAERHGVTDTGSM